MRIIWFVLFTALMLSGQSKTDPYIIQPLQGEIILDGKIDEAAWEKIIPFPLVSHWPQFGNAPSNETELRVTYDENYIYVSGLIKIDPDSMLVASFKRDIFTMGTDYLIFILDTFNDNENALNFSTTPTGTRSELAFSSDAEFNDVSWDTFWDAEAVYNDSGWSAEMRIPFSSIGFQEQDGLTEMGMAVVMYTAKKYELVMYPAIEPNWGFWSWAKPSQLQKVQFKNVQSTNPVYITPYLLGGVTTENSLNKAETAYREKKYTSENFGLDVRYNITNNLTLDFSYNTDFAQVEADDQQVNLTRFSLFFPEKRRFFLERASIFDFNFSGFNRLFYTRNIGINDGENVDILAGGRLSGRVGDWDVGLLNVQTRGLRDLKAENFAVARVKKQLLNPRSFMGGMVTNRVDENGSYNLAMGLDGLFNLFDEDYLSFSLVQSHTDTVNNNIDFAKGSRLSLRWERRSFTGLAYDVSLERSGEEYMPGMGYEERQDFSHLNSALSYGWAEKGHPYLQRHRFAFKGDVYTRNIDNYLETLLFDSYWEAALISGVFINSGIQVVHESLREGFDISDDVSVSAGHYTFPSFYANVGSPGGQVLSLDGFLSMGKFYDGTIFSLSLSPKWIVSKYAELTAYYEYNNIDFDERNQFLHSHITRLKGLITLNTKLSLSAFVQYNNTADIIFSNARFRYNPSEGHDLYIVYNELFNSDRERYNPVRPLSKNRTLLAKYTYTFTF